MALESHPHKKNIDSPMYCLPGFKPAPDCRMPKHHRLAERSPSPSRGQSKKKIIVRGTYQMSETNLDISGKYRDAVVTACTPLPISLLLMKHLAGPSTSAHYSTRNGSDELLGVGVFWIGINLLSQSLFYHLACFHHHHVIRHEFHHG